MTLGGAMHPPFHRTQPRRSFLWSPPALRGPPVRVECVRHDEVPEERPDGPVDPVAAAVSVARKVCKLHGLSFISHPTEASTTISGRMSCPYVGKQRWRGLLEDRQGRGMNDNLTMRSAAC